MSLAKRFSGVFNAIVKRRRGRGRRARWSGEVVGSFRHSWCCFWNFCVFGPVRINEAAPAAHFLVVGVGGGGREVGVTGSLVGAGGEFR